MRHKVHRLTLQWSGALEWSKPDTRTPLLGITWIELIFHLLTTTQEPVPINVAPYKQECKYVTTEHPEAAAYDLSTHDFSHTITSFQRAIKHVQFLTKRILVPPNRGFKTGSLYYVGVGASRNGVRSRPILPLQGPTMQFLSQYPHPPRENSLLKQRQSRQFMRSFSPSVLTCRKEIP